MSFDAEDILQDFADATGGRREFFDADSYTFRRLGRLDNADLERLASLLRYRRWAQANRERQRAISRASYQRHQAKQRQRDARKRRAERADPRRHAKRLASWRAFRERRNANAAKRQRVLEADRERSRRRYAASKARQAKQAPEATP